MKIFGFNLFEKEPVKQEVVVQTNPTAFYGTHNSLFTSIFDGEKNFGEIGPIKKYAIDYEGLRSRSWQAYLESELAKTIIDRYTVWNIGGGLKLQSEPVKDVLLSEGIKLEDSEAFSKIAESRFAVWSRSNSCDFSGMVNLNKISKRAFINSLIGGDVLVVLRYDGNITIQLIDGSHVCSPYGTYDSKLKNGNTLSNGIEIDSKGRHVAYHVKKGWSDTQRIEAKGKSGLTMAFMVYGSEYRLDNNRGLPLISTVLETLKKLERYKEATVGSAEERQKIAYTIEHDRDSTGQDFRVVKSLSRASGFITDENGITEVSGEQLATNITATTNKQTFNMPIGAALKSLESKNELYFKEFYSVNWDLLCASVGMPPEVAMSKYDSNFSSARAAIKDWEHSLNVRRKDFSEQFMQNIYNFWLHVEILSNKIQATGYVQAKAKSNNMILDSYRNARFVGPQVPHIDPLKEVKAEREKLGSLAGGIPLTTVEAATEALNGGESNSNLLQFSNELDLAKKLKIEEPKPEPLKSVV